MGNTSLPNTNGRHRTQQDPADLDRIAARRTWPQVRDACRPCIVTTPSTGSGSVTASCSPPTCNVGFPLVPASLSRSALRCPPAPNFFTAQYPQFISCQQLIPAPVYAETAVSGLVTGATTPAPCSPPPPGVRPGDSRKLHAAPLYSLSTAKAATGGRKPSARSAQFPALRSGWAIESTWAATSALS